MAGEEERFHVAIFREVQHVHAVAALGAETGIEPEFRRHWLGPYSRHQPLADKVDQHAPQITLRVSQLRYASCGGEVRQPRDLHILDPPDAYLDGLLTRVGLARIGEACPHRVETGRQPAHFKSALLGRHLGWYSLALNVLGPENSHRRVGRGSARHPIRDSSFDRYHRGAEEYEIGGQFVAGV